jgi:hypothetical protein
MINIEGTEYGKSIKAMLRKLNKEQILEKLIAMRPNRHPISYYGEVIKEMGFDTHSFQYHDGCTTYPIREVYISVLSGETAPDPKYCDCMACK